MVLSKRDPVSSCPMAKPTVPETKSRLLTSLKTWLAGNCTQCCPPSLLIKSGEIAAFPLPCDGPLVAQPWFVSMKSTMAIVEGGCVVAILFQVMPPSCVAYRPKPEALSSAERKIGSIPSFAVKNVGDRSERKVDVPCGRGGNACWFHVEPPSWVTKNQV